MQTTHGSTKQAQATRAPQPTSPASPNRTGPPDTGTDQGLETSGFIHPDLSLLLNPPPCSPITWATLPGPQLLPGSPGPESSQVGASQGRTAGPREEGRQPPILFWEMEVREGPIPFMRNFQIRQIQRQRVNE